MRLFDSHAHYYDEKFAELGGADSVILDFFFNNCDAKVLNVGTNNTNSKICIAQAAKYPGMYAAAGIHPLDCRDMADISEEISALEAFLTKAAENKIIALGEIGLDYYYGGFSKIKQIDFFDVQMQLARKHSLPVIIHDRESHGDCLDMIKKYPDVTGVFHSFSGSAEMAREVNKCGWYVSFSGVVTFKNAKKIKEVAAVTARDMMLIETDAPYLAPHPHRGKINHSGLIVHTADALAEILGISPEGGAELTYNNTCKLFGLK